MKRFVQLLVVATLAINAGCATYRFEGIGFNPKYERGQGEAKVFDAPFDRVWKVIPQALTSLGFDRVVRDIGLVRAFRPHTHWGGITSVALFVDRVGVDQTRVEIISKTPNGTKWIYREWAPDVTQKIELLLAQEPQLRGFQ